MHPNSRLLFERYARPYFTSSSEVLEIGPDAAPSSYQQTLSTQPARWDTLDFAGRDDIDLTYRTTDDYSFPVPDDTYDVVAAGNVIEHVRKTWLWTREVARVLKPGGVMVNITPVTFHHHPAPVDCWRIYPDGMRALCDDAGLEVLLATYESIELERVIRRIPDRYAPEKLFERLAGVLWLMNRRARLPVPRGTFDTIAIARKPATA